MLGENTFAGQNLSTTIDYKLSDRDVLTNILSFNQRGRDEDSRNAYTELDADGVALRPLRPAAGREQDGRVLDYTLAFKRTFEPGARAGDGSCVSISTTTTTPPCSGASRRTAPSRCSRPSASCGTSTP